MATHYSVLGLFDPRSELDGVFNRVAPVDVFVDGTGAEHSRFVDASGAALVAHANADGLIACVTPFFVAPEPALWTIRHSATCIDAECVHCSGADVDIYDARHAHADQAGDDFVTRATVQLTLGAARRPGVGPAAPMEGEVGERAVVAFAHDVTVFDDAAAFHAAQDEGAGAAAGAGAGERLRFAAHSFLPMGMFSAHDDDVTARAQVRFSGTVLRGAVRKNAWSGATFLHFVVDSFFGPIDVVADAREHDLPARASVVTVSAWLVAE